MYFWNVKALAEEIRANTLTDYQKMLYFTLYSVLTTLAVADLSKQDPSRIEIISSWLNVIITFLGVIYCYRKNKGHGSFIEKMTCLGLPIAIRIGVCFLFGFAIVVYLWGISVGLEALEESQATDFISTVFEVLASGFIYWRLGYWIEWTQGQPPVVANAV